MAFLPNPLPTVKVPFLPNPIPYLEYFYLTISIFFNNLTAPNKESSNVG